jgi:hypothetical protein
MEKRTFGQIQAVRTTFIVQHPLKVCVLTRWQCITRRLWNLRMQSKWVSTFLEYDQYWKYENDKSDDLDDNLGDSMPTGNNFEFLTTHLGYHFTKLTKLMNWVVAMMYYNGVRVCSIFSLCIQATIVMRTQQKWGRTTRKLHYWCFIHCKSWMT